MALSKIIINQMTNAAKNAFKMEIVADKLKGELISEVADKVEDNIPITLPFDTKSVLNGETQLNDNILTEEGIKQIQAIPESQKANILLSINEIEKILNDTIVQKNQIQGALNTLLKPISTLESLTKSLGKVIPALNGAVTILKLLPIPTSVPPGVGLPSSVIINFADSLSSIKIILDKIDGPIEAATESIPKIQKLIIPIVGKLKLLDPVFTTTTSILILIKILLEYGPFATQQEINQVIDNVTSNLQKSLDNTPGPIISQSNGVWVRTFNAGNRPSESPITPPPTPISPYLAPNNDIWTYFSDNAAANNFLLSQLTQPNNNPLIYKGFQLQIETDPNNKFTSSSRRIKASFILSTKDIQAQDTIENYKLRLIDSIIYNLPDKTYSFSASVQALIAETYYEIDQFISGEASIQTKINIEYIYDSQGVAVGRRPGFPGYTIGPTKRNAEPTPPFGVLIPEGSTLNQNETPVSISSPTVGQQAINQILGLPPTGLDSTITTVGNTDNTIAGSLLGGTFQPTKPTIFQSYLDRYPDAKGEFYIEYIKPSKVDNQPVKVSLPTNTSPNLVTPPSPPNPLAPFNVRGDYNFQNKIYKVPNTNPEVLRNYQWSSSLGKWSLISTSEGNSNGIGIIGMGPL